MFYFSKKVRLFSQNDVLFLFYFLINPTMTTAKNHGRSHIHDDIESVADSCHRGNYVNCLDCNNKFTTLEQSLYTPNVLKSF